MAAKRKILITGAGGQLGRTFSDMFAEEYNVALMPRDKLDITSATAIADRFEEIKPDIVINTAAYTDVDGCEENRELAFAVNADGPGIVADACRSSGAWLIHFSTDYVFDGEKGDAYTEDDQPRPLSVYGESKLQGERNVVAAGGKSTILRVSWVYSRYGRNFVSRLIDIGRQGRADTENQPLRIVNDEFSSPTWAVEIVRQTEAVIQYDITGLCHAVAGGETTRFGLAADIFDFFGADIDVEPCPSSEFPQKARRPKRSTLTNARLESLGLNIMRPYREALLEYLEILKQERT